MWSMSNDKVKRNKKRGSTKDNPTAIFFGMPRHTELFFLKAMGDLALVPKGVTVLTQISTCLPRP